jgi:tRNA threonylcarbamoyladenosine biosynthesis protein TsaB
MIILGLESSTSLASVAINIDGKVAYEKASPRQRSHSEFLNPALEEGLKNLNISLNQIDLIVVGNGPGSFTGIRVAANLAKTLSYALNKPLLTIDSLRVLALQAVPTHQGPILSILNAYKNLVYYGLYDFSENTLKTVKEPSVCNLDELESFITQPTLVVGDGYSTFQPYFSPKLSHFFYRDLDLSDFPLASTLSNMGAKEFLQKNSQLNWRDYSPLYIRASEAEENLERKNKR